MTEAREDLVLTSPSARKPVFKGKHLLRVIYRAGMAIGCAFLAAQHPKGSHGYELLMRQMRRHGQIMSKIGLPDEKKEVVRKRTTA